MEKVKALLNSGAYTFSKHMFTMLKASVVTRYISALDLKLKLKLKLLLENKIK